MLEYYLGIVYVEWIQQYVFNTSWWKILQQPDIVQWVFSLKTSGLNMNKHHLKPNGIYKLACLMFDCFYSFYESFAQSFIFVLAQKFLSLNVDNAKLLSREVILEKQAIHENALSFFFWAPQNLANFSRSQTPKSHLRDVFGVHTINGVADILPGRDKEKLKWNHSKSKWRWKPL